MSLFHSMLGIQSLGITRGSFLFDAGTKYLVSSAASLLNDELKGTNKQWTMRFTFDRDTINAAVQTLFSRDNNSGGRQFAFEFINTSGVTSAHEYDRLGFFLFDSSTKFTAVKTNAVFANTNSTYDVFVKYDGTAALASRFTIWVNDVSETYFQEDTGGGVGTVNDQPTEPIYIAVTNFGGLINPFKGRSHEIAFYNGLLQQADVDILWNGGNIRSSVGAATSVSPMFCWNPGMATLSGNWTMPDAVGTSYGVSKNFVSSGMSSGDRSLLILPDTDNFNAASDALFAAMTTAPGFRDKYIIDATIQNMINDGDWANILDLGFTAAHDEQAARLNWKTLTEVTAVGSPTFTTDRGFTFNGSSQYLRTGRNLSSGGGGIYTLNSGCMWTYNRLNINAANVNIGGNDATNGAVLVPRNGGNCAGRINGGTGINLSAAASSSTGKVAVRRTTAAAQAIFRNGASVVTNTGASAGIPNAEIYVGANNNNGTAGNFSTNQIADWGIASGAISQANTYTREQQYMMSKGANV